MHQNLTSVKLFVQRIVIKHNSTLPIGVFNIDDPEYNVDFEMWIADHNHRLAQDLKSLHNKQALSR